MKALTPRSVQLLRRQPPKLLWFTTRSRMDADVNQRHHCAIAASNADRSSLGSSKRPAAKSRHHEVVSRASNGVRGWARAGKSAMSLPMLPLFNTPFTGNFSDTWFRLPCRKIRIRNHLRRWQSFGLDAPPCRNGVAFTPQAVVPASRRDRGSLLFICVRSYPSCCLLR